MSRTCPVCNKLINRFSRAITCSYPCGMQWRNFSGAQKSMILDRLDGNVPTDIPTEDPTEMTEELKELLAPKSTQRENDLLTANEALKSIFGDKKEKEK